MVCGWAVAARAQLEYPTIQNLTRESPTVVISGGAVTYGISRNPDTAPFDRVRFMFHAGAAERMEAIAAADPASGRVSATIDPGWKCGAYRLVAVSLRDTWGRTTIYDAEGLVTASAFPSQQTPYYAGPSPVESLKNPRLVNLSVLKQLGDGLKLGFSIAGASPVNVLVRAVGPGLAQAPFNIADHVRDPRLVIFRGPERIAV